MSAVRPFWEAPIIRPLERGLSLHINAGHTQHVYPVVYFRRLARGEAVEPPPPDVLAAIIREWLESRGVDP